MRVSVASDQVVDANVMSVLNDERILLEICDPVVCRRICGARCSNDLGIPDVYLSGGSTMCESPEITFRLVIDHRSYRC